MVTVEEGQVANGFGAFMAREISELEMLRPPQIMVLGIGDEFIQHGARDGLRAEVGLDAPGIARRVREGVARRAELEPA